MQIENPAGTLLGLPQWNSVRTTKIFPPRLSGTTVERRRLIDRLNLYHQYAVTLVVAPAGFGKTTLLAQWLDQPGNRAAWLSLDGHERTVLQFVADVVASLMEWLPENRTHWSAISRQLESHERTDTDVLLKLMIDAAGEVQDDFTLILDDYHNVESHDIHAFLKRLIDHLPARMHLIVGGRTVPPFDISRLRARGLLRELRAPQLKFQFDEAQQFLNEAMSLHLNHAQVNLLEQRTEGWVAGLQLAALSLQEAGDVQALVNSFSGTNPYVLGYLADEVLKRQPADIQDFLLKTSILTKLSGDVCDYVTETSNGQEMLERLEQMNLFIVALDERRQWYRYHQLFADLLHLRLSQRYAPTEIRALHRRAAEWYLEHECIELGVDHALNARDWDVVRRLVEPAGLPLVLESRSIHNWLMDLPEEELRKSPSLAVWAGWTILSLARYRDALHIADIAEEVAAGGADPNVDGYILTLKARIGALNGDGKTSMAQAKAALEKVNIADHAHRAAAYYALGMAYNASGLPVDAEKAYAEALRQVGYMKSLTNTMTLLAVTYRARAILLQGRIADAWTVTQEAGDLAADFAMPKAAATYLIEGEILLQRNHLEAARDTLIASLTIGGQRNFRLYEPAARVLLTTVYCALGNTRAAQGVIGELRKWSVENMTERHLVDAEAAYMRRLLETGHVDEVARWVDRIGAWDSPIIGGQGANHVEIPYEREREYGVTARLLIERGFQGDDKSMIQRGLALLERLRDTAAASSRRLDVVAAEATIARTLWRMGSPEYLRPLEAALKMAVDEQAYWALLEYDGAFWEMLDKTGDGGRLRKLIDVVRAEFGRAKADTTTPKDGVDQLSDHTITEPLSEREREVLNLLASGLSTKEIADSLIVSANTVKTHTRHIYDKLDARNRTQAITRARDIGILE